MCGYFAVFNTNRVNLYSKKKMLMAADLLKHRGPDKRKVINYPNLFCKFFRLKILDLSDQAMQPMVDINKKYLLLFNGEIYICQTKNLILNQILPHYSICLLNIKRKQLII